MTIPSAVLGEYLSDVQRFYDFAKPSVGTKDIRPVVSASLLARNLNRLYGEKIATDYLRWLLDRANEQHRAEALARREQERAWFEERKQAAQVEEPKRVIKRKDAAYNEWRMREAVLSLVGPSGWVKAGIRALARRANIPHTTARHVLDRMATDGQVELDTHWGQGKRTGVHPLLDHPCWSDYEMAQLARNRSH